MPVVKQKIKATNVKNASVRMRNYNVGCFTIRMLIKCFIKINCITKQRCIYPCHSLRRNISGFKLQESVYNNAIATQISYYSTASLI